MERLYLIHLKMYGHKTIPSCGSWLAGWVIDQWCTVAEVKVSKGNTMWHRNMYTCIMYTHIIQSLTFTYIYTYRKDMSESKSPTEGVISIWHMSLHLVILKTKRIRSCHASFLPLAAPLGILQRRWICGTPIQRSGPACPKLNAPRTGGIGEVSLVCYPFGNMFSTRFSESVCDGQEKLKEVIANVTWL